MLGYLSSPTYDPKGFQTRGIPHERIQLNQVMLGYLLKLPIKFYQVAISPLLGPKCRFQPSCSHYMIGAIDEWGGIKGLWLGIKRIGKCHPWGPHGHDPVPTKPRNNAKKTSKK